MDKNSREKDMLYQWAKQNNRNDCFQEMDNSKESYFVQRKKDNIDPNRYIREYTIESLPELMKELDTLWGTDEVMCQMKKAIGVAALKNKPVRSESPNETEIVNRTEPEDKLPAFIYNF